MAAKLELPDLLKHMALAIYNKRYISGSKEHQLNESFNIARGKLAEWGYLTAGSAKGPLDEIRLTAKGNTKNNAHRKEQGSKIKSGLFDVLFENLFEAMQEKKSQDSSELPAGQAGRELRQDQRETRLAKSALGAPKLRARTRHVKPKKVAKPRRR